MQIFQVLASLYSRAQFFSLQDAYSSAMVPVIKIFISLNICRVYALCSVGPPDTGFGMRWISLKRARYQSYISTLIDIFIALSFGSVLCL